MATIDRADWHSGGDFPEHLPEEAGGTHIGMYLTWILENDLSSHEDHENTGDLQRVLSGELSGRDYLFDYCDGKFWSEDLTETGAAFTTYYYSSNKYYSDYERVLAGDLESLYEVANTRENYLKLKPELDARFAKWTQRKQKRFWQFWK